MSLAAFLAAVLALLLAPGPTNTLMALAGAGAGLRRVVRLVPAELAGYLAMILPLVALGAGLLAQWPVLALALKAAAAVWVMLLAVRLWRLPQAAGPDGAVTLRRVFVTTFLNPKALVFGLVLLPLPADPAFPPRLGLFVLCVVAVALVWGASGSLLQRVAARAGGGSGMRLIQRAAAVWLAAVSAMLAGGLIAS